jgi:hypothetical protein
MSEHTYVNCLCANLSNTRGATIPKGWVCRSDARGNMAAVAVSVVYEVV